MQIYTRRFFAVTKTLGPSWQTLWTVPETGVYILRHLIVGNLQSTAGLVLVDVLSRDSTVQTLLGGGTLQPTSAVALELRQELLAGERVRLYSPVTGGTALATGYYFPD